MELCDINWQLDCSCCWQLLTQLDSFCWRVDAACQPIHVLSCEGGHALLKPFISMVGGDMIEIGLKAPCIHPHVQCIRSNTFNLIAPAYVSLASPQEIDSG